MPGTHEAVFVDQNNVVRFNIRQMVEEQSGVPAEATVRDDLSCPRQFDIQHGLSVGFPSRSHRYGEKRETTHGKGIPGL